MTHTTSHLSLVPSSLSEVNDILAKIGQCERQIETVVQTLEAKVAKLRAEANIEASPAEKELKQLTASLLSYATAHRSTLLVSGKKSVVLPGGEFGWRLSPPKVVFGRGGAKKVTEIIQSLGLKQYLRTVVEPNKEALLADRPVISGVKYDQTEGFFVKPSSSKEPETFPGKQSRQKRA